MSDMSASADMSDPRGDWAAAFFDEDNIVSSFQNLLVDTQLRVEDLCTLCIAAHEHRLVLALSLQGLMPFASRPTFVLNYANMTPRQLCALRKACSGMQVPEDAVVHEYNIDVVLMSSGPQQHSVDDELILFAAACILAGGLTHCSPEKHGVSYKRLEEDTLRFHVNTTVFKIVNACRMKQDVERGALRLLSKHRVTC